MNLSKSQNNLSSDEKPDVEEEESVNSKFSRSVKGPTLADKEILLALEEKDFERLEVIENETSGFSEETGRRLFQLWRATEISSLEAALVIGENSIQNSPKLVLNKSNTTFTLIENFVEPASKMLQFLKFSNLNPSFRSQNSVAGIKIIDNKGDDNLLNAEIPQEKILPEQGVFSAGTKFNALSFKNITIDIRNSVPHITVSTPVKELLVFSKASKKAVYDLKNCENISLPLSNNSYIVVVEGYECAIYFNDE